MFILVAALFSMSIQASAAMRPVERLRSQWAQAIARDYWGGNPPCGPPSLRYSNLDKQNEPDQPGTGIDGWVRMPPATDCVIRVDRSILRHNPERLCVVIAHEWRHLQGFVHTDVPGIMSITAAGWYEFTPCLPMSVQPVRRSST